MPGHACCRPVPYDSGFHAFTIISCHARPRRSNRMTRVISNAFCVCAVRFLRRLCPDPDMQAAILPIHAGWFWIHQGYRICMKQPLAMFFWSMTLGLLITFSYLIPIFGQMALIIATPSFTFITLGACRRIDRKSVVEGRGVTRGS